MTTQTTQRLAQIAVTVQFLALVRTLFEFIRLEHAEAATFTLSRAEPYIVGGLIAAILTWLGVIAYLVHRYAWTALMGVATVLVLIVYKLLFIP